jgi:hypothetical protein
VRVAWILLALGCGGGPAGHSADAGLGSADARLDSFPLACGMAQAPVPAAGLPAGTIEDLVTGVMWPGELAVDADHVYFAYDDPPTIARVPRAGGAVTSIASAQREVSSLDAASACVCWASTGTRSSEFLDGSIRCAPKAGGPDHELAAASFPRGIAVGGESLFWAEGDGQKIRAIGLDGTGAVIVDDGPTQKNDVAVSTQTLAWTASSVDMADVVAMDLVTREKVSLSSSEYAAGALVIAGRDVFWVAGAFTGAGTVRVSRAGGEPHDLVVEAEAPRGLVLIGDELFWASSGEIRSISTAGGEPRTVASGRGWIGGLTTDGTLLYWSEIARGAIVRAAP